MAKPSLYPDRDEGCFLCGNPYVEQHHIFPGNGRRPISDREGCTVYLCHEHHQGRRGVHFDSDLRLWLQRDCQKRWEQREGVFGDPDHDSFRDVFYDNFL